MSKKNHLVKNKLSEKLSDHGIEVILTVVLLLSGGFYDYSAMVLGALLVAAFFWVLSGRNGVWHYISMPVIFILWQLPVSIWAIDRYQTLAGLLRLFPLIIWMLLCSQSGIIERRRIMSFIPCSGAIMTLAGIASYITGIFRDRMWMADRFGGTFQYANTCALYLLLGIIMITDNILIERADPKHGDLSKLFSLRHIVLAILISGLLLTGSRSILIIAIIWGIYKSVRERAVRLPFVIIAGISAALGGLYAYITGNMQNIGRIFTSLSYSSTFFGRLLYMKDGIKIILKHPWGLGYRGYYYVQPLYQNGVYNTRFVHNDYLQAALDVGLVPALLLFIWLAVMIIRGRIVKGCREMLAVILISSFFDLHMQYELILMIALLCFDLSGELTGQRAGEGTATGRKAKELSLGKLTDLFLGCRFGRYTNIQRTEDKVISCLIFVAFAVLTIPFAAYRLGVYELSLRFFAHDTETQIGILSMTDDAERARNVAMDVIRHNRYIPAAYRHLAFTAMMSNEYESVLDNMDEVVRLNRYDLKDYELYDTMLDGIESAVLSGQSVVETDKSYELLERVESTKEELPLRLKALEETTDPLAYKLRDVPEFSWE